MEATRRRIVFYANCICQRDGKNYAIHLSHQRIHLTRKEMQIWRASNDLCAQSFARIPISLLHHLRYIYQVVHVGGP